MQCLFKRSFFNRHLDILHKMLQVQLKDSLFTDPNLVFKGLENSSMDFQTFSNFSNSVQNLTVLSEQCTDLINATK